IVCVMASNNQLRYATSAADCRGQSTAVTLSYSTPLFACGTVGQIAIRVTNLNQCSGSQTKLTLPGATTTYFCTSGTFEGLYYATDPSTCAGGQFPVVVNPDTAPTANSQSGVSVVQPNTKTITLTGTDAETCELTFTIVTSP